jgi:hypothetical protein
MSSVLEKLLAKTGHSADFRPNSKIGQIFRQQGVADSKELNRIVDLPRRTWTEDDSNFADDVTDFFKLPYGTMKLRPIQAIALSEMHDYGGLFGSIKVGAGKTLLTALAPTLLDSKRPLLLIPAKLREKTRRDFAELRKHWQMVPEIRIESYEMVSRAPKPLYCEAKGCKCTQFDGVDTCWCKHVLGDHAAPSILDMYAPDLIISDESQKLSNIRAAVTRRTSRYMRQHPSTKFVALSGTITKHSLHNYHHIISWCLPKIMPLPRHWPDLVEWAYCLDERVDPMQQFAPGALFKLMNGEEIEQAKLGFDDAISAARKAYRRRLTETAGVVATSERYLGSSLSIEVIEPKYASKKVEEAFRDLRDNNVTPDGQSVADPSATWRHAREFSCGFFYVWWNQKGFNECLKKSQANACSTLKNGNANTEQKLQNKLLSIEQNILNDPAFVTALDTELVEAVAILNSTKRINAGTPSRLVTGSLLNNTRSSSVRMAESVICAGKNAELEGAVSRLITITKQGTSVGYSARLATERLECWVTILKASSELLRILSDAIDAARPPKEWLVARSAWAKFVREVISHNRTGVDSELQVAQRYPHEDVAKAWKAVRDTFTPNSVPVWFDDSVLQYAAKWMTDHPGIVWVEHRAFGHKLSEMTGAPYYSDGGCDELLRPIEEADVTKPIIASIASNAEGRNLQGWHENLIVSLPPTGTICEQLLGRTHRDGQTADEVTAEILVGCIESWDGLMQAKNDARYLHETLGQEQKLLHADWIIPDEDVVRARKGPRWVKPEYKRNGE